MLCFVDHLRLPSWDLLEYSVRSRAEASPMSKTSKCVRNPPKAPSRGKINTPVYQWWLLRYWTVRKSAQGVAPNRPERAIPFSVSGIPFSVTAKSFPAIEVAVLLCIYCICTEGKNDAEKITQGTHRDVKHSHALSARRVFRCGRCRNRCCIFIRFLFPVSSPTRG